MYHSALIGQPTGHSVSDLMYEQLARAAGISERYVHLKLDLAESQLGEALKAFQRLGFKGINVTHPHKLCIMDYLDEVDQVASALGAVNTIKLTARSLGYNTDWLGIVTPLKERLPQVTLTRATILGSGGAARAAIYACKHLGIRHTTVLYRNASSQKTRELRDRQQTSGIAFDDYSHVGTAVENSQLIINTTPAGTIGEAPLPFDLSLLSHVSLSEKIYFEVVFNPPETPLAAHFKSRGAQTIDGLWMMLHQGIAALSLWLDREIILEKADLTKIYVTLYEECRKKCIPSA